MIYGTFGIHPHETKKDIVNADLIINNVKNNNIRKSTFFFISALISELLIIMSMAYGRALPYLFTN